MRNVYRGYEEKQIINILKQFRVIERRQIISALYNKDLNLSREG